jgi:membrane protein YdbS with pleckstrin-like domain
MSRLLTTALISIGVLAAGAFALAAYLMTGLIAIIAFGCVIVLAVMVLLGDFACRRYLTWRERRDMRVRDRDMRKWGLRAFDQGKERKL